MMVEAFDHPAQGTTWNTLMQILVDSKPPPQIESQMRWSHRGSDLELLAVRRVWLLAAEVPG